MSESRESKHNLLHDFSFSALKETARPYVQEAPYIDSPFYYMQENAWLFLREAHYAENPDSFTYTGCKIHINVLDPKQIPLAWDTILPILGSYRYVIRNAKVLMEDALQTEIAELRKQASHEKFMDRSEYKKGKIYQYENTRRTDFLNSLLATEKRYAKGANISFYFYLESNKNEMDKQTLSKVFQLFSEIEAALQKSKIMPGNISESDFPIKNCKFISARVDTDEKGNYFHFDARKKTDFVNNTMLKKIVAAEELIVKDLKDTKQTSQETKLSTPQPKVIVDIGKELIKLINFNTISYWKNETASTPILLTHLIQLSKIAEKKMTREDELLPYFLKMNALLTSTPTKGQTLFQAKISDAFLEFHDALVDLFHCKLQGLDRLEQIAQKIKKYNTPTVENKKFKPGAS